MIIYVRIFSNVINLANYKNKLIENNESQPIYFGQAHDTAPHLQGGASRNS
jgi:hypothetical protein